MRGLGGVFVGLRALLEVGWRWDVDTSDGALWLQGGVWRLRGVLLEVARWSVGMDDDGIRYLWK